MSQKDYVLIAGILNRSYLAAIGQNDAAGREVVITLAAEFAAALYRDNNRFDAKKFADAIIPQGA